MIIKMDKRLAMRELNNSRCEVIVNNNCTTTFPPIIDGKVKSKKGMIPIENINRIEYTDRFGFRYFMEVNWDE